MSDLSIILVFTRLGLGRLDRDGRDSMKSKYYLSARQFNRLSPPTLEGSRLHVINDMEFGGLSDKLLKIHRLVVKQLITLNCY